MKRFLVLLFIFIAGSLYAENVRHGTTGLHFYLPSILEMEDNGEELTIHSPDNELVVHIGMLQERHDKTMALKELQKMLIDRCEYILELEWPDADEINEIPATIIGVDYEGDDENIDLEGGGILISGKEGYIYIIAFIYEHKIKDSDDDLEEAFEKMMESLRLDVNTVEIPAANLSFPIPQNWSSEWVDAEKIKKINTPLKTLHFYAGLSPQKKINEEVARKIVSSVPVLNKYKFTVNLDHKSKEENGIKFTFAEVKFTDQKDKEDWRGGVVFMDMNGTPAYLLIMFDNEKDDDIGEYLEDMLEKMSPIK